MAGCTSPAPFVATPIPPDPKLKATADMMTPLPEPLHFQPGLQTIFSDSLPLPTR
jgi:hypothetical protein